MKAFLRILCIDFPLVLVFVIGHFLGFFPNPDLSTYSEDPDADD